MLVHGFTLRLNRDNRVYSNAENRMIFFKNLNEYIVSKPRDCLCGEKTSNDWKSICTMRVLQTPNHECVVVASSCMSNIYTLFQVINRRKCLASYSSTVSDFVEIIVYFR